MLSEGQRNDINFAIPVLEHINSNFPQCFDVLNLEKSIF